MYFSLILAVSALIGWSESGDLVARRPLAKEPVRARVDAQLAAAAGVEHHLLVVKFIDPAKARAEPDGVLLSQAGADLAEARALAMRHGVSFAPLLRLPESLLRSIELRAERQSGTGQPDLAGMLVARTPGARTLGDLERIGNELQRLSVVEFVDLVPLGNPPPGDIAPPTPDLSVNQTYRGANPGMNADFAAAHGINGLGLRISDCEYGWNPAHEDLNDIDLHLEPGQTIHPDVYSNGWDEHGTAVLGETSAVVNGYGCSGMIPGAEVYTYPEWTLEEGFRRETCIAHAIADSSVGDIVLLEMQTTGPGGGYGPAELDKDVWVLVKAGTDAGVVIVGAAGNGDQNLDGSAYSEYRSRGDSGALIVGAGSSNTNHDKLSFSTYGARVNVQGWGQNVFTIGYGGYAMYGGDENQSYTASFSGTSSASPFVTSAAVAVQSYAVDKTGMPMASISLRDLLIATGVPQGSGGHIGPFVDLEAAIEDLNLAWTDLGNALAGTYGDPVLEGFGLLGPGDPYSLNLTNARETAFTTIFVGSSTAYLPFKGGVLVPSPNLILPGLFTQADGTLTIAGTIPAGLPSDFSFYVQIWLVDGGAIQGFAASNALEAMTL